MPLSPGRGKQSQARAQACVSITPRNERFNSLAECSPAFRQPLVEASGKNRVASDQHINSSFCSPFENHPSVQNVGKAKDVGSLSIHGGPSSLKKVSSHAMGIHNATISCTWRTAFYIMLQSQLITKQALQLVLNSKSAPRCLISHLQAVRAQPDTSHKGRSIFSKNQIWHCRV